MQLPGVDRAVVDAAKIRDYLLSDAHPVGRFKAAFFVALGYSATAWRTLEADLRAFATANDATPTAASVYGQKYEVRGRIRGPAGRSAALATVWSVLRGEDFPRFVTAFPGTDA